MAGLTVEQLQTTLNNMGVLDDEGAPLEVDGVFGPKTEAAWISGMSQGPRRTSLVDRDHDDDNDDDDRDDDDDDHDEDRR